MKTLYTRLIYTLPALLLTGGLAACAPDDQTASNVMTAGSFDTAVSRSQAAARDAERTAAEAEAEAKEARKAAAAATSGARAPAPAADKDELITAAVRAGLQRQPALRGQPIQLYTAGGVVWLRGSVASDAAKEQAELAASATDGVVAVRNRLDVRH